MRKRPAILALLLAGALASLAVFHGSRLLDKARPLGDPAARIAILEREQTLVPLRAEVYAALGKAYLEQGVAALTDPAAAAAAFERCHRSYVRALSVDPFDPFTHFQFAQALLYMDHLALPVPKVGYFNEFERSAALANHAPEIYFEVGKVLISRWATLSADGRAFTLEVLKRVVSHADAAHLSAIFHLWELSVPDFKSVEEILPRDRTVYRQFALFLGERSLERNKRLSFLSQAESLDFEYARNEYATGLNLLQQFKLKEAEAHLQAALDSLSGIRFYQSLLAQVLIDPMEYQMLQKDIHLGLAKCKIEETRNLEGAIPALRAYLALEDRAGAVTELERFLKERGFLQGKNASGYKDFALTAFEALMSFKQNRYRDVVDVGTSLEQNFLVIPEAMKPEYARILELVGDSYQKLDFIYESNRFYEKARTAGGDDLDLLLKIRRNYERLNDADQLRAINAVIGKLIAPREIKPPVPAVAKGEPMDLDLTLDGEKAALTLNFGLPASEPWPLVSILFNGHVLWEDYLRDVPLVVPIAPNMGVNVLRITPLNQAILFESLSLEPEGAGLGKGSGPAPEKPKPVPGKKKLPD